MLLAASALARASAASSAVTQGTADPWQPIRFLEGTWIGTSEGEPGKGTVERMYTFVLKSRFLQERNVSTYPAQAANASGEVHEHWTFFSYDRKRAVLVMRQFHQEGFVNQLALTKSASTDKKLVFDSESLENLGNWRARETYEIISNDEFIETFEIGQPGQPLHVYSRNHFKRARQ
jgi:hypothetical protein